MGKNYWLFKSEPDVFSIDDLQKCEEQITYWDGVRNYQARNFLRDSIKSGDLVLFYNSNCDETGVVGTCMVVRNGYADFTQFDPKNMHYDESAVESNPTWFMVDIKFETKFTRTVTLAEMKANPKLENVRVVQRGNRLSVLPVTEDEFYEIVRMSRN